MPIIPNHGSPMIIGHRGAPGYRPEHTRSSYELAIEMGVHAVEPDLVLTKDGKFVIRHENEISQTTNVSEQLEFRDRKVTKIIDGITQTGWFTEDFTLAELKTLRAKERLPEIRPHSSHYDNQETILTLSELSDILATQKTKSGKNTTLIVELKHVTYYERLGYDYTQLFAAAVQKLRLGATQNLIIESFELSPLLKLKKIGIQAEYIFLLEHTGIPADEPESTEKTYEWYRSNNGLKLLAKQVDGISVNKTTILETDPDFIYQAKSLNLKVFVWTLRPENYFLNNCHKTSKDPAIFGNWKTEWDKILATGVDGLFLDHPDLINQLKTDS